MKSEAERKRAYRARKREALKAAPSALAKLDVGSFAEFLKSDPEAQSNTLPFIKETLGSVGMQGPDLTVDADPAWRPEWEPFGIANRGAIGLAERMVDAWIDSAKHLADLINRFHVQEVEAAQRRLLEVDLSDPQARAQALAEAVRLDNLKRRLAKEVRHSFSAITVKGD